MVLFVLFLVVCGVVFFQFNKSNYATIKKVQHTKVEHPELLPKKEVAQYTSFGFANLRADIYWIEAIQYIWANVMSADYKKYLSLVLDLITELNPYFEKPYIIGQLLLPAYNDRYETLTDAQQLLHTSEWEKIGLKGIKNFCDAKKIKAIEKETDLNKVWSDPEYKNPCKKGDIPFGQAFLYYYYLKDYKHAALYYKIASANTDTPVGAKVMTAIMNGKTGDRETSIMMFLIMAQSNAKGKDKNTKTCFAFSSELMKYRIEVYKNKLPLDETVIAQIDDIRNKAFPFDKDAEKTLVIEEGCANYVNKAVREFNLAFLDQINVWYFKKNNKYAMTPEQLKEEGYIHFVPKDYQQYDTYGIIYQYSMDTKKFDYKMWDY